MTDIVLERPVGYGPHHATRPEHDEPGFGQLVRVAIESGSLISRVASSAQEHLGDDTELTGLSELDLKIYAYAAERQSFRVEEMRRAIPVLQDMSDEAYKEFKDQFEENRERICASLEQQGISRVWHKTGRTRGTRYQLMHPDDVPAVELVTDLTTSLVPVAEAATAPLVSAVASVVEKAEIQSTGQSRERIRDFFKAARFTTSLLAGLGSELGTDSPGGVRRKEVQEYISRQLGESVCAQTLIAELTEARLLAKAPSSEGHTYLTTSAVPLERIPLAVVVGGEPERSDALRKLRAAYVGVALEVLSSLAKHKHAQQGTQAKRLHEDMDMPDLDYADFKAIIVQLEKSGIVTRNVDTRVSRNKRVMVVKFASKAVKEEYLNDRPGLVAKLENQALVITN